MDYNMYRMQDASYRASTWEHLRQAVEKQEAAAREVQEQILEESACCGDTVRLSHFLTGQITRIETRGLELPMALVVSEQPTGARGETATRSEWVALKGLQIVAEPALQPAPDSLLLPEPTAPLPDDGTDRESGNSNT
jgi:hypothetical protein